MIMLVFVSLNTMLTYHIINEYCFSLWASFLAAVKPGANVYNYSWKSITLLFYKYFTYLIIIVNCILIFLTNNSLYGGK